MVDIKKSAETLLESAQEANIKLPRGRKECLVEVKNALKSAEDDGSYDMKAALKALEDKFGRGKQGPKGKKEPEGDTKPKKRKTEVAGAENSNKRGKSNAGNAEGNPKKGSAKAASSSSAPSSSSSAAILEDVWDVSNKKELKAKAEKIVDIAKSRGVKMPEDDAQARVSAGRSLMGIKSEDGKVKVKEVIQDLEDTYGKDPNWVDPDNPSSKKKKPSKAKQCTCPENQGLVDAFDELAGFYFKEGSKAGIVYKKVVSAIKDLPEPMTSAPKKKEIAGIGPKSIDLIKEYLETGGMELLEEKRAAANEL